MQSELAVVGVVAAVGVVVGVIAAGVYLKL